MSLRDMPRRVRLLPELGAAAVEPLNSGGVSLIDATSKASRPTAGVEGTGDCAWLGQMPINASAAAQGARRVRQRKAVFMPLGRQQRWPRWENLISGIHLPDHFPNLVGLP